MYIDQIPVRSKISISFDYVAKSTNLETTVKRAGAPSNDGRIIITDAVRVNGKVVNINNFRGRITVQFTQPGAARCEIWKHVRVKYDRVNKEYHLIAQRSSEKHERRKAPRFPIGLGATVQVTGDQRRHNCTIYDISTTGVGLRMEALNYSAIGRWFEVSFTDKSELISLTINCRCVREVDKDGKVKIYGCTLKKTADLLTYIRKKQAKYLNTKAASKS